VRALSPAAVRLPLLALTVAGLLLGLASAWAVVPPGGPLRSWSFSDTNAWTDDAGYSPISFTNLTSTTLGDGTALVVDSTNPAWLNFKVVEQDLTTNLALDQGSVIFWVAPTSWASVSQQGSGPGAWASLLQVGAYPANPGEGYWGLGMDPAGANLYFAGQSNNGTGGTYLSTPISWTTNRWHNVALTYSSSNSSLYIDGALAASGSGVQYLPGPQAVAAGFYVASDPSGLLQAHAMLDDLATYNYQLDPVTIAVTFQSQSLPYYANPMNAANMARLPTAPSTPSEGAVFDAVTGHGDLQFVTNAAACSNLDTVYITNVSCQPVAGGGENVFFTIGGGSNGVAYDVFATTALAQPMVNAQWYWMGQGYACSRYLLPNVANSAVFLILGTPLDSNAQGLTDAYQLLVCKTNPYQPNSSGLLYGWDVEFGLTPTQANLATQDPEQDGLDNLQKYLYGANPAVSLGFSVWLSSPSGLSGLP